MWQWLKNNDIPNSVCTVISVVFIPLILLWWSRRHIRSVTGLQVQLLTQGKQISMPPTGQSCPAVALNFKNNTGKLVFIVNPTLRLATNMFPVVPHSSKDFAGGGYELKFLGGTANGALTESVQVLQTQQGAETLIGVTSVPTDLNKYQTPFYKKICRCFRTYFVLEYTAIVGGKSRNVRTIF
jgi:hypothetical protein